MRKLGVVAVLTLALSLAAAVPAFASGAQFATAVTYATGNNPYFVASGDVNGDSNGDLLTADFTDDAITVLLGAGDGTFTATTPVSTLDQPQALAIGDYNEDSRNDIAVTTKC
jgi:FG-GAP-like repeat